MSKNLTEIHKRFLMHPKHECLFKLHL